MSRHAAAENSLSTAEQTARAAGREIRGDQTMWHKPRHSAHTTTSDLDPVRHNPIIVPAFPHAQAS